MAGWILVLGREHDLIYYRICLDKLPSWLTWSFLINCFWNFWFQIYFRSFCCSRLWFSFIIFWLLSWLLKCWVHSLSSKLSRCLHFSRCHLWFCMYSLLKFYHLRCWYDCSTAWEVSVFFFLVVPGKEWRGAWERMTCITSCS